MAERGEFPELDVGSRCGRFFPSIRCGCSVRDGKISEVQELVGDPGISDIDSPDNQP